MGRRVAERAGMMAESLDVPLHLVHVLEPVGEAMIEPSLARLMRQYQEKEAVQLSEWTKERTTAPVSLAVVKGSPSWELTALAKTASLVVVGSSTLDAFSVGPVAKRVGASRSLTPWWCGDSRESPIARSSSPWTSPSSRGRR
jgi:nucleotide-binding universal stress UspA family protein